MARKREIAKPLKARIAAVERAAKGRNPDMAVVNQKFTHAVNMAAGNCGLVASQLSKRTQKLLNV